VNALANDQVGDYVNEHFASSFLKVGTFTIAGGAKQGGNVASYFCLPDGSVLHAIPGPVDANTFLKEARWVVETRKLALFDSRGNIDRYKSFFRTAHADRLQNEYGVGNWKMMARSAKYNRNQGAQAPVVNDAFPDSNDAMAMARVNALILHQAANRGLDNRAKAHLLLTNYPLVKVEQVYKYVFENILNEKVSTLPVAQN
jgi:hypothetical protein